MLAPLEGKYTQSNDRRFKDQQTLEHIADLAKIKVKKGRRWFIKD